jgi:acetyl esterase/lipase
MRMQKMLAAAVASFLLSAAAFAAPAPVPGTGTYTSLYGIEWARIQGQPLYLDVHTPADSPGPHPTILWLHTGAWITGDREGGPALKQARRGYAVVSIDYRLAPLTIFPGQLEDVKAAVRWIRANAAQFNFDPDRVGVFGASAGGHLAALLGTTGGIAEFEGLGHGNVAFSSRVRAVVDWYGPTDLLKLGDQALPCMPMDPDSPWAPTALFVGCPIQECSEQTAKTNPMRYITPDDPPFLIVHGTADCLVPWRQSQLLYDALRAAGHTPALTILEGGDHGGSAFNTLEVARLVADFLDRNLRGETPPAGRRRTVRR